MAKLRTVSVSGRSYATRFVSRLSPKGAETMPEKERVGPASANSLTAMSFITPARSTKIMLKKSKKPSASPTFMLSPWVSLITPVSALVPSSTRIKNSAKKLLKSPGAVSTSRRRPAQNSLSGPAARVIITTSRYLMKRFGASLPELSPRPLTTPTKKA